MQKHILIVDDEYAIRKMIRKTLEHRGMFVFEADTGKTAINMTANTHYDLIILDIVMDGTDGLEVVKALRKKKDYTPIMMLSGKFEDQDKIFALGIGADDYITKPFSPAVLCAKVEAMLRHQDYESAQKGNVIEMPPFKYVIDKMRLFKDDKEIYLSPKESLMMLYLLEHAGKVCPMDELYRNVWCNEYIDENTVMVHIRRLRSKIEDSANKPVYLQNIRGAGYKLCTSDHSQQL